MTFDIVVLALVAAFLGLRLYSVLGKRTGHEQKPIVGRHEDKASNDGQSRDAQSNDVQDGLLHQSAATPIERVVPEIVDGRAETGVREIMGADRGFNVAQFGLGAKAAYEMTLKAFWSGDRDTLQKLCDADVYADFEAVINAREAEGQIVENRLVRIDQARIVAAEFDKPIARITVQFDADVAALTKDKDGNVIAGSLSDAIETHDVWTFERDINSDDRNWTLTETDVA